jgi:hypothetical protein
MDFNIAIVGVILLLVLCLIGYIITRNRKDRKKFEEDLNQSEMRPEHHENEKERM